MKPNLRNVIILLVINCVVIYFLTVYVKNTIKEFKGITITNHSISEKRNQDFIDSIKTIVIPTFDRAIDTLKKSRLDNKNLQTQTIKSYEKIYQQIFNSNDSIQLIILDSLLARHRSTPVKRD